MKPPIENNPLREMISQNFIEYASYVIKDRAIPHIDDGLKPVQRRILHSLFEMDDGKFHKVANVVGNTMKYHPHGDMAIYSALVTIANKDLFIEKQGNFGNDITGDPPSAARYIECRLTPLAKDVLFNKELTEFTESYDGRNLEPVIFPCKIPVVLIHGAEGIAVGMSTKILPHNFIEVLKAQIAILQKKNYQIYPDFLQGGLIDVSQYNKGQGKIKVRSKIEKSGNKTLIIHEIPFQTTTESLIQSIEDAARKNKIKVSSINDYTTDKVEIEVVLQRGADIDKSLNALYAFTQCEVSLNLDLCVIQENRPVRLTVDDLLNHSTHRLKEILKNELEWELNQLNKKLHKLTLERIFIENRLYKHIENCKSKDAVNSSIYKSLEVYKKQLVKPVDNDDIEHLLSIPIRRISLYDIEKNKKDVEDVLTTIKDIEKKLKNITKYSIQWLEMILKKYSEGKHRKSKISTFESVDVREVASKSYKLSYDKKTKYIGTNISGADTLLCSNYDRILIIDKKGKFKVMNVPEKIYIPDPLCHFSIFDPKPVYNVIYRSAQNKYLYAKRFKIEKYILEKDYEYFKNGDKLEYFSLDSNPKLILEFNHEPRKKLKELEFDFKSVSVQNYKSKGIRIINRSIKKIKNSKKTIDNQKDSLFADELE